MPTTLQKLFIPGGRVILGLYFLLPGLRKFTDYQGHADYMASHDMIMIPFFLVLAGLLQVGGAFALCTGYRAQWAAFLLAGLTLIISLVLHDFWTMAEGLQRSHETQNFIKNMAIMGGLLVLAGSGPGAFSLESWRSGGRRQ